MLLVLRLISLLAPALRWAFAVITFSLEKMHIRNRGSTKGLAILLIHLPAPSTQHKYMAR
jgi:hypothetical protein